MGYYLYGIVSGENSMPRIQEGVEGGEGVHVIGQKEIGALVSNCEADVIRATEANLMAHEKVLEEVLRTRTVLPFEFGTVAPSEDAVTQMLVLNRALFRRNLSKMEDKFEFNVKAAWHNMPSIFQEIVKEHPAIAHYKAEIAKKPPEATYQDRIRLGTMVAEALQEKKRAEGDLVCRSLKHHWNEVHKGEAFGDEMILNCSYLIRRQFQETFEKLINELGKKYEGRLDFKYYGPMPPYSFVYLPIKVSHAS